jgi:hypothetical protein
MRSMAKFLLWKITKIKGMADVWHTSWSSGLRGFLIWPNQKVPGFESRLGQELPLVGRCCISLLCYAASTVVTSTWFNKKVNSLSLNFIWSIAREPNWPGQKFIGSPLACEGWVRVICNRSHPHKAYCSALRLFTACTGGNYCGGCVCTSKIIPVPAGRVV